MKMTINERIKSADINQLIKWWNREHPPQWAKSTHLFFDKVASAMSKAGPSGISFLKSQAESNNDRRRYLAIRSLARKEVADDDVVGFLVRAFYEDHPEWKGFALVGLVSIEKFPLKRREVEELLNHSNKWVAAEAMVYLSQAHPDEAAAILREGLRSSSAIMRGHACSEAGFRNIRELKEEVGGLLKDEESYVARAAKIGRKMFETFDNRA